MLYCLAAWVNLALLTPNSWIYLDLPPVYLNSCEGQLEFQFSLHFKLNLETQSFEISQQKKKKKKNEINYMSVEIRIPLVSFGSSIFQFASSFVSIKMTFEDFVTKIIFGSSENNFLNFPAKWASFVTKVWKLVWDQNIKSLCAFVTGIQFSRRITKYRMKLLDLISVSRIIKSWTLSNSLPYCQ